MENVNVVKGSKKVVVKEVGVIEVGVIEMVSEVKKEIVVKEKSFLESLMELDLDKEMESKEERSSRVKKDSKSEGYLFLMREGKDLSEINGLFNKILRGVKSRNVLRKEGKLIGELEKEVKVYYSEVERVWKKFIIGGYGDSMLEGKVVIVKK